MNLRPLDKMNISSGVSFRLDKLNILTEVLLPSARLRCLNCRSVLKKFLQ